MKEVLAIIRRQKAKAAKDALAGIGFPALHVIEVEGRGKERGLKYSGKENAGMRYLPKKMLSLVVRDEEVAQTVNAIIKSSRTDEIGDGKIFIIPVEEVIRIRTGERGKEAI